MSLLICSIREVLFFIHSIVPNWGVAIVLFSFTYRLVLFPLQLVTIRESRKLRKIQPELKRLLERYKESPQTYFAESSRLKKREGVRSWVLPVMSLIQVPIFMAVYRSIPKIEALQSAPFFWIHNLSVADPYFVLPLLVFALMYWHQKSQVQEASISPWVMPSMSFLFMMAMPSALVLHSLVSMFMQFGGDRLISKFGA